MRCDEVREAADSYAIGALDPAEREAVERHIETCPACQEFIEMAGLSAASLALTAPLVSAPRELHARLLRQIEQEEDGPKQAAPVKLPMAEQSRPRRSRPLSRLDEMSRGGFWQWQWPQAVAAALAVILLVGCAVWIARLQSQVNRLQTRGQELERVRADSEGQRSALMLLASEGTVRLEMQPTDPSAGVAGAVIWNPDRHKCSVFVSGLQPAPPDQTYHVWLVGNQHSWDSGELITSGSGTAEMTMDLSRMDKYSGYQVVVSLQPSRAGGGDWSPVLKAWVGIQ